MENSVGVQKDQGLQDLVEEALGLSWGQCLAHLLHVLLQVVLQVLENQVELLL